jgi:dinuclear metal center YbgI/SA1388 family protein
VNKGKFYRIIESICPSELAEDWDNCGIQIDTEYDDVDRVLVALEVTDQVIREAIDKNVDMIVTHHPLIFGSIRSVDCHDVTGGYVYQLIRNGISVYSCHTSFDALEGGNNDYLGNLLRLQEIERFETGNPLCRKGVTPYEISLADFVRGMAASLGIEERKIAVVGDPAQTICTVGWCTGSGTEFIRDAAEEDLDLFITGDLKYHQAQEAKARGIAVIDAGHYGTEKIFVENMAELLSSKTKCEIIRSRIDIDPFL